MSEYEDRNIMDLKPFYIKHVNAMTAEKLHEKSEIAAELAYRDKCIADLKLQISEDKAEIARLKERLEIGFGFDLDGNRVKLEGEHPDGIDCRNETIKLLEKEIDCLREIVSAPKDYITISKAVHDARLAEIAVMQPMIEACKARYDQHYYTYKRIKPPLDLCQCLTCQWYRDYLERKHP